MPYWDRPEVHLARYLVLESISKKNELGRVSEPTTFCSPRPPKCYIRDVRGHNSALPFEIPTDGPVAWEFIQLLFQPAGIVFIQNLLWQQVSQYSPTPLGKLRSLIGGKPCLLLVSLGTPGFCVAGFDAQ